MLAMLLIIIYFVTLHILSLIVIFFETQILTLKDMIFPYFKILTISFDKECPEFITLMIFWPVSLPIVLVGFIFEQLLKFWVRLPDFTLIRKNKNDTV